MRTHGWCGASATTKKIAPQKNFRAKPKQAGKKEGGLGEGIFARLLLRAEGAVGVESGGDFSVRRKAHKSVFPSLIEKNLEGAREKEMNGKTLLCAPAVRRYAVAGRVQSSKSCGFRSNIVRTSSKKHRQISLSEELEGCASRRSRSARHFAAKTKRFFKLIASVRSPMRGFAARSADKTKVLQPIFFFPPSVEAKRYFHFDCPNIYEHE